MTGVPESTWSLMIPFITTPGFALKENHTVTLGDLQAEVRPGSFGYTRIMIDDIESAREAHDLFEAVRIGMQIASININWGIRVPSNVLTLGFDSPMPNQPDVPLIYPKGKSLRRMIFSIDVGQMSPDKVLPKLLKSLELGLSLEPARRAMSDDRVKLAVELYIDSHFETSDSARFVGLVGVLEVLKDKDSSSDAAKTLIDKWRQEARSLAQEEANSIQSNLAFLKSISISRGIGSVVKRHLGEDRMKEARDLYTARSSLVHDGIRPIDSADTVRCAQQIVRELLASILMSGSR